MSLRLLLATFLLMLSAGLQAQSAAPGGPPSSGATKPSPTASQASQAAAAANPQPPVAPAGGSKRPTVALVLSGGGARGFAHIGVLRVLRELHIPVDMVVGTSMGSVIGGAYAAGASVAELDAMARDTDWDSVIADRPARDDLAWRRREEDLILPSRIEFGVSSRGVSLPPAAAGNAALETALTRLLPPGTRDKPASALPLPFRSVASDLLTGELVELSDTPLFLTMRASLAVPGVFAPVRVKQRLVVDGGLVRNLPVDMARAMGADVVIAVNVGTTLAPEEELGSAIGVAQQMLQILTEQNVQRSIKELGPNDILVSPDLRGITFLDFSRHERAIKAGEQAAWALAPRLQNLAVPAAEYAVFENRRLAAPALDDAPMALSKLEVQSVGQIKADILKVQSGLKEGDKVTQEQVRKAANSLYGRGDVARVETDINDDGGQRSVVIKATEADWANSRLRAGLELASDFDDSNSFSIKLMHVRSSIGDWGGELRTVARIGSARDFGMQYHQPLGPGSPWYVMPELQYGSSTTDLFTEGRRIARLGFSGRGAVLQAGRQFDNWGDLRIGVQRQKSSAFLAIPADPTAPVTYSIDTNRFISFNVDTLDSLAFPSRGVLFDARLEQSPGTTSRSSQARSSLLGLVAYQSGNWAGHVSGSWARAQNGAAPLALGGFLQLSGTQSESVTGRSVALARLVTARKIGSLPATLGGTVRAGFSVEMGGAYDQQLPIASTSFKVAGSAFFSVDTRFGPLYFAAGSTRHGGHTLYLFLGPIW